MKQILKKTAIVSAIIFGAATGFAEGLQTQASQMDLFGDYLSSSTFINQDSSGEFALELSVLIRGYSGKIERSLFRFEVNNSNLTVEGNDLFLLEGRSKTRIAHTEWWYSPKWQVDTTKVKIQSNVEVLSHKQIVAQPELTVL